MAVFQAINTRSCNSDRRRRASAYSISDMLINIMLIVACSTEAGLSNVFVGLTIRFYPDKREYALVIHDGQGVVGQEQDTLEGPAPDDIVDRILKRVGDYAKARGHRIAIVAVSGPLDPVLASPPTGLEVDVDAAPGLLSRIWLDLDAIPFLVSMILGGM
jgi:hypothetical protein